MKSKHAGGRPAAYNDPKLLQEIIDRVKYGVPLKYAAASQGIAEETLLEWLRRAKGEDRRPANETLAQFAKEIGKARAEGICQRVLRLTRAAMGVPVREVETIKPDGTKVIERFYSTPQTHPDEWYLERQLPEEFSAKQKVQIGGDPDNPVPLEVMRITSEQNRLIHNRLAKILAAEEQWKRAENNPS